MHNGEMDMGKMYGIEKAVVEYVEELQPRHGGVMVDQLETLSGRVFRRSDGWALELCMDHGFVHIQKVGWSAYKVAAMDLFRHAGGYRVTDEEIASVAAEEQRAHLAEQREKEAAMIDEFERAFDSLLPEYEDAPEITAEFAAE